MSGNERKKYQDAEVRRYRELCAKTGSRYIPVEDPAVTTFAQKTMEILQPMAVVGHKKVRIGGPGDGGYVLLDPGEGGIAYSFGVSDHSPWDLAMADKKFLVHQYDGSIDEEPDKHPNIFFHKCFVGGENEPPPQGFEDQPVKSLRQIIHDNNHENERDILLQVDIEGGEWGMFDAASEDDLLRFKQIIVEFHSLPFIQERLAILRKLARTHTPIHIHYNNNAIPMLILPDNFFYGGIVFEATFVRSADYTFSRDRSYYPTPLDSPCLLDKPEIPLGFFDIILNKPTETKQGGQAIPPGKE